MKQVIVLFLLLTASFAGHTQTGKWSLGLEGGPALVSQRGNEILSRLQSNAVRFSAGAMVQRALSRRWYLRGGISVTQKGSRFEGEVTDENGVSMGVTELQQRQTYLSLPLLAGVHMGSGRNRFFAHAGPWVGFLLRAEDQFKGAGADGSRTRTGDFHRADFGIAAGLGGHFPLNNRVGLSAELRDELGLLNTSKLPVYNGGAIRNNALLLLVGVRIGL